MKGFFENAASSGPDPVRDVYRAMQGFDIPMDATSIRIAVRDTSRGRVGALEVPLPLGPEPDVRVKNPSPPTANSLNPVKPN